MRKNDTTLFGPPYRLWTTLNRFRPGQGRCAVNITCWNQASDLSYSCGAPSQTMAHIVNDFPQTISCSWRSVSLALGWHSAWLGTHAEQTL